MDVVRLTRSTYFSKDFETREKNAISQLAGLNYAPSLCPDTPSILLSNTHLNSSHLGQQEVQNIELIVHPNSGHDNLLFLKNYENVPPIILGNEIRAGAVCDYILACLLSWSNLPSDFSSWPESRIWPKRKCLKSLNVVVFGKGEVGKRLEHSLQSLVASLSFIDPYVSGANVAASAEEKNWRNADVIIFCCELSRTSRHLLNQETLKLVKSDCCFINPARGAVIDTNALMAFLDENPEAFAFLDVFETEPADFPSMKRGQLHLSPHIAGVFPELEMAMIDFEQKTIAGFLEAKKKGRLSSYFKSHRTLRLGKSEHAHS